MGLKFDVILTTNDLSIFKTLLGNRPLNETKVLRFVEAFKKEQLPWCAIVNENFEVIDCQHKIEACKRLGLPVTYMIKLGYGLKEAQAYNRIGGIWLKGEHLDSLAILGNPNYVRLKEFRTHYPEFKSGVAECIVTNYSGGHNQNVVDGDGTKVNKSEAFRLGLLQIADIETVYDNASKIMEYKPYLRTYNSGMFVKTLIHLFKIPKFDNNRMIKKLAVQPTKLKQCATRAQYMDLLEDIYNYKVQAEKKFSFKYAKTE